MPLGHDGAAVTTRASIAAGRPDPRDPADLVDRSLGGLMAAAARLSWLVLGLALIVTAAAGFYIVGHLRMETDMNALLSADLPHRKTQAQFDAAFPQLGDNIVIVVDGATSGRADKAAAALAAKLRARDDLFKHVFHPDGDPFFRKNGLLFLEVDELHEMSDRLADAQPLLAVLAKDMSLRGLFDLLSLASTSVADGESDPAQLVRAFDRIADTILAHIEGRRVELDWSELMQAKPAGRSDLRRFILAQPYPDYSSLSLAEPAIDTVRSAVAELGLAESIGVRVRLTGGIPIRADELRSVSDGVGLASAISLVVVTALVVVGLRSVRLVIAIVLTLGMGLVVTAGFAALAIGHLNLLSVAFAVMFIGLAVDFGIQIGLRYKENRIAGLDHRQALRRSGSTAGAVFLAALCATIGFLAFVPTAYVGLAELGIISAAGMVIGTTGALTVLPALLTVMRPGIAAAAQHRSSRLRWRIGVIERFPGTICVAALALGLVSLVALPTIRFDADPIALDDPDAESVQTYLDLARDSSTSPYMANVVAPTLDAAAALARRLDELPVVDSTITLQSFIPQDQDEKLQIIASTALFLGPALETGRDLPPPSAAENRAAAARFLSDVRKLAASTRVGPLAEPARRLAASVERLRADAAWEAGGNALDASLFADLPRALEDLRLAMSAGKVALADLPADLRERYVASDGRARVEVVPRENLTDRDALRRFVSQVQRVAPDVTDTPVLLLEGGDAITGAFVQAGAFSFVLIASLLVAVLRSIVASVLVLLPLALALALTVATMAMIGMSFNFANIIALPLLLTLGVAFGIYLVLRYRETAGVAELLRTSTPRAVLFSALTTLVAFASLMASSHRGTAGMGALLAICLTLALCCTLVVLPALLALGERRRADRRNEGKA
ncbi:MAG: MMPL family transporter [Alphaproteobacteria bacterium]|nr:MMPL family transporter [Alphaproteobacteria bacterium]